MVTCLKTGPIFFYSVWPDRVYYNITTLLILLAWAQGGQEVYDTYWQYHVSEKPQSLSEALDERKEGRWKGNVKKKEVLTGCLIVTWEKSRAWSCTVLL